MTVKNITSAWLKPKEKSPRLLQSKSNYGARSPARSPTKQPEKNSAARHYLGIKGQDISVGNPGRLSAGLNKQLRVDRVRVFVRVSGVCAHFHAPACSGRNMRDEERERERAGRLGCLVAAAGSIDRRGCAQAALTAPVSYCVQISPRRPYRPHVLFCEPQSPVP